MQINSLVIHNKESLFKLFVWFHRKTYKNISNSEENKSKNMCYLI